MSSELDLNLGDNDDKSNSQTLIGKILSGIGALIMLIPRKGRIVLTIVGITFLLIAFFIVMQPEAKKRPIPENVVKVDVVEVAPTDYPITVTTNGTIQAVTRGNLVAQLRGEIVQVSDKFRTGGSFQKGEVLAEIDQRDYIASQSQALASVSQAKAAYRQELANAKQAKRDWERLGNTGQVPELVARKPQLEAAEAQLESAEASLETAKLNLERTYITAPYTGRVIQRQAVLGQYVSIGSVLAEIFATEGVEVTLPLSQEEFAQLGLDALSSEQSKDQFAVSLSTQVGSQRYFWDAQVTRADSTFDLSTRQIDVIASVIDPFSSKGDKPPLKIGQFVNASIQGRTVEGAIVVPNKALREGNYVFVSQDQTLERRPVSVIWQDDQYALIESGLTTGDIVVTTSLNSTLVGAKVKFANPLANQLNDKPQSEDSAVQASSTTQTAAETSEQSGEPQIEQAQEIAPDDAPAEALQDKPAEALQDKPAEALQDKPAEALENTPAEAPASTPIDDTSDASIAEPRLKQPTPNGSSIEPVDDTLSQQESGGALNGGNAATQN